MDDPLVVLLLILMGYLCGSLPTSYIIGRIFFGLDLREHGSGNVGATNALRVLGKKAGMAVLVIDMAKGSLSVLLARYFIQSKNVDDPSVLLVLVAVSAMLGHVYTLWLRFAGGKGVATSAGVLLALSPLALFIDLILFSSVVALSRYVSLGSILAALFITPLVAWEAGQWTDPRVALALIAAFCVILRHRSNLSRLLSGEENKI